jgi:hypothetical protein
VFLVKILVTVALAGAVLIVSALPANAWYLRGGGSSGSTLVTDCTTVGVFPPGMVYDSDCVFPSSPSSSPSSAPPPEPASGSNPP